MRIEKSAGKPGGGYLYFRLDIILVKGLSKHPLNTYFSGMKKDLKYAFLHTFFLICESQIRVFPGGLSYWHGVRICDCLLGRFFAKFGIAIGGFLSQTKEPKFINWVYFGQIIVKNTQFGHNWVLFFWKRYTDGWEIRQNVGIEKVGFLTSGRHIHIQFWWK